jgi:hypothetical protein
VAGGEIPPESYFWQAAEDTFSDAVGSPPAPRQHLLFFGGSWRLEDPR